MLDALSLDELVDVDELLLSLLSELADDSLDWLLKLLDVLIDDEDDDRLDKLLMLDALELLSELADDSLDWLLAELILDILLALELLSEEELLDESSD